ncbi:MAG: hypothetical protein RLZZ393_1689 [Pseudomonadota bacterium]
MRFPVQGIALLMLLAVGPAVGAGVWKPTPYQPVSRRDFTGIWENRGGIGWRQGIPPGIRQDPPLTPAYRAVWQRHLDNAAAGHPTGDPTAGCLPQGMPRIMTMTYPMEIVMNARQVNIFAEWNGQTRRIFTDGRSLPAPDDVEVTFNGTSVGHWEGDVLVATTVGMRPETNLESSGLPHSDVLVVKERIWLDGDDLLKDEITLVDAKAYTQPWTVTKAYHRAAPGAELIEYVCLENQRNPVNAAGEIGVILAPQKP